MVPQNKNELYKAIKRVRIWYGLLILVVAVFGVRLFDLQVLQYQHYKTAALSDQLKQYEIPASRGIIEAHNDGKIVPIVLNQQLYTLYADPTIVKQADKSAAKLAPIIHAKASDLSGLMQTKDTRYVILGKKLTADQQKKIAKLELPGVGTQGQDYRTYAQGELASQILGFVNDSGSGEYGIEQALNNKLSGTPGQLKAITDVNGVPLAASKDNTKVAPKNGDNVVLTIDMAMQAQLESIVKAGAKHAGAQAASALIMDPDTGAIKAMANYPTYDPAKYSQVSDANDFQNAAVDHPIEVGSIMKTLTTSASLDQGIIQPSTTFYDPAHWKVDGFTITDIEEDGGPGTRSIADILNLSLNTGATWMLMQMGGGQINTKARTTWHDYMVNHFQLGKPTGIEQGYEAGGYIPSPADNGAGIDLTYANTSFGQAMTATPLQMGAALSSVLNGGTYYKPYLVDQMIDDSGHAITTKPKVVQTDVVGPKVGQEMIPLMQYVVNHHNFARSFDQAHYMVGGKTGTAQIAKPGGGYYDDLFNGTYMGFVGGNKPQYVIVVFVYKPTIGGYAGTAAAQPIFGNLAHMLIDNSYVTPKS
ncbi:MAG TPA: penicillin-binding protein 2 [Candidatus Saccharimonadales bacterium]|nr:penicillin-binding protein 2 [Candidatus Saccharimonadales bacterium]